MQDSDSGRTQHDVVRIYTTQSTAADGKTKRSTVMQCKSKPPVEAALDTVSPAATGNQIILTHIHESFKPSVFQSTGSMGMHIKNHPSHRS